jgi:hypothetical protein
MPARPGPGDVEIGHFGDELSSQQWYNDIHKQKGEK